MTTQHITSPSTAKLAMPTSSRASCSSTSCATSFGLTGTHVGCDTSHCGACTVLVDGQSAKSCTMLAVQADGAEVTTIEGMASGADLHPLQQAFWDQHGLQCGFCTPGMIMQAAWLLEQNAEPTEAEIREGISGNLCRCTGYVNIVKAIQQAAGSCGRRVGAGRGRRDDRGSCLMATEPQPQTTPEVGGMGHSVKRKEDPRFIRGKGEYIEDVVLPGMLWLDIVRSPYAHATIKSIDASEALKVPGVLAVVTGKDLEGYKLHWMPTLAGDMQMVLPDRHGDVPVAGGGRGHRHGPVCGRRWRRGGDGRLRATAGRRRPVKALEADAPVLRPDRGEDKQNNHIWHWESGDRDAADAALAAAEVRVAEDIYIPRIHVASIETCGCVADWDPVRQQLTLHITSQAPHAIRTVLALVAAGAGLPISEQNIRVKTHDIGGGFGGKVPVYPGYVLAVAASFLIGKPVKWIEDRSENLQADSFARDYHIHAELGATKDGKITGLKVKTIADHGYSDAAADPSKFPAGLFNVITGSYDFDNAFVEVDGVYTNKPPGGVAYRCSFRVTEAVHAIERMVDVLAHEIGKDPAELRMENFIQPEQFPYKTPTGWEYDSGNYPRPCVRRWS